MNNSQSETTAWIALGTSSWSFSAWRGVFYPETLKPADYLAYYAQQFPAVEVNTSFYGLPAPTTLINWVESVPPGFVFTLKAPRIITHDKRLVNCTEESLAFLDVLAALGPAAGPALLQFPPDFTRAREGRSLAAYLDWLASVRGALRFAVEVRAGDLMTPTFAAFLAERGFALTLVDRRKTPDLYDAWRSVAATVPFALVRWIGDDRSGPKGDREITAPQDERLDLWAARLADLARSGISVFGYMHNPYEGHAPASVRRLTERLARLGMATPWPPAEGESGESPQLRLL
jgi:uncharacterized protein YecE (DUF72 family)